MAYDYWWSGMTTPAIAPLYTTRAGAHGYSVSRSVDAPQPGRP
ncbi:MAG: hypothetical protein U0514_00325 [Candidatus Andersenbacteria bacterium]